MPWWLTVTGPWRFPTRRAKLIAFSLAALTIALVAMSALAADDSEEAWKALVKGGHVALIRHGNAPPGYGGDPPGFRFDDCKTQRNLDDKGRAMGKALGEAFRSHGVRVDRVVSSPVCRCMDTASLMAVGQVESSWALVPDRDPTAPVRLRELKEIVSSWRGPGTLVLVTHGFTIRPLIGIILDQAETAVLRPTPGIEPGARVVGRIAPTAVAASLSWSENLSRPGGCVRGRSLSKIQRCVSTSRHHLHNLVKRQN